MSFCYTYSIFYIDDESVVDRRAPQKTRGRQPETRNQQQETSNQQPTTVLLFPFHVLRYTVLRIHILCNK